MKASTMSLALASMLACACSDGSKTINLGANRDAGADATADAASSGPTVIGAWKGYMELETFPSGSSAFALVLAPADGGGFTGTLTFGDRPAPPPPTDADAGYPAGFAPVDPSTVVLATVEEGFAYSLQRVTFDGTRLRFSVAMNELWKAWCELQPTVYTTPAEPPCTSSSGSSSSSTGPCGGVLTYGCLPTSNNLVVGAQGCPAPFVAGADGGPVTLDCGKVLTCWASSLGYGAGPCSCTATSCTMDTSHPDVAFDVAWTPGHLDGSSSAITANSPYATSPVNVHFTAQ